MIFRRPGRILVALVPLLLLAGTGAGAPIPSSGPDFRPVLLRHAAGHPKLQVQDCYKLLFQACLGAEHAVQDEAGARRWLEEEIAGLPPGPDEPPVEPVSPDGSLVRVHLRPFVARRGDAGALARAFFLTARARFGTRQDLAAAWPQVVRLAAAGQLPFTAAEAEEFGRRMAAASYPAVRHTETFRREHAPAYRVIAREFLPGVLPAAQ